MQNYCPKPHPNQWKKASSWQAYALFHNQRVFKAFWIEFSEGIASSKRDKRNEHGDFRLMSDLKKYRDEVDKIDSQIIKLLKERVTFAEKIQDWKVQKKSPTYMPDRELKIYQNLKKQSTSTLQYSYLKNIFREIMSSNIAIENPDTTIGYLGPLGSFTHHAALEKFGNSLKLISISNIDEVFDRMHTGEISYGVVPLENSQEGIVNETLDNLIEHNIYIYSEIKLPIRHAFISHEKETSSIRKIYTHRQAFYQCKRWIQQNVHDFEWIETASTSKAVQLINTTKEKNAAAIGSAIASEYYNTPILHKNITTKDNNFTRFIVLSKVLAKNQPPAELLLYFHCPTIQAVCTKYCVSSTNPIST